MAPLKRGPKAKSKDVVKIEDIGPVMDTRPLYNADENRRKEQVWWLAANLLEARVKQSTTVHPAAIVELASYAKQLANEVYGPE